MSLLRRQKPPLELEMLAAKHSAETASFVSGNAAIDAYLSEQAFAEQSHGLASVQVAVSAGPPRVIVGYFTLSPLSVRVDPRLLDALEIDATDVPYPAIGGYLLGRMGVAHEYHGQGIGSALVAIALAQSRKLQSEAGGAFLAVDPKDDDLVTWYESLGFIRLTSSRRRCVCAL